MLIRNLREMKHNQSMHTQKELKVEKMNFSSLTRIRKRKQQLELNQKLMSLQIMVVRLNSVSHLKIKEVQS